MSDKKEALKVCASIAGFQGAPASVVAVMDSVSGKVLIRDQLPEYTETRPDGMLLVTNSVYSQARDALFSDDHFSDAIQHWRNASSAEHVRFAPAARNFSPSNCLEQDSIAEGGVKWRINSEISNQQVAVLALVWFSMRQRAIVSGIDFMSILNNHGEPTRFDMTPGRFY